LTSRADGRVCPILLLSSSCKVRAGDAHGKSALLESHCLGGQQTDAHHFARPREVELHPYLQQGRLLDLCDREGIKVTAFSPLGSSSYVQLSMDKGQAQGVLADEAVKRVASSVGKTPAQVVLRWAIQRNVIVIPKTSQERRLDENASVWGWELSAEDMAAINGLERGCRYNDPGEFCRAMGFSIPIYD
jgi:D-xylose reductase